MEARLNEMNPQEFQTLLDQIEIVRESARDAQWSECQQGAIATIGQGYALLRQIQARRISVTTISERMETQHRQLADALIRVARSNHAEPFFTAVQEQLPESRDDEIHTSIAALAQGETSHNELLSTLLSKKLSSFPDVYDLEADFAIAGLTQGLLAQVHAMFNQRLESEAVPPLPVDEQTLHFQNSLDTFAAELRKQQLMLYQNLVNKSTDWRMRTSELAFTTAGWIEANMLTFVLEQAEAVKVLRKRLDAGQGTAAEIVGNLLARAGFVTRQSLATQAAAYRLALESLKSEPRDGAEKVLHHATEVGFDTEIPNGSDTTLAKLTQKESGQFIEIWGIVKELKVLRLGGHLLVTRITLQATKNNATAVAVARFVHLPHAGLTRGAFVRLSGFYQEESDLNDDAPAVEIEQLSLAVLAESSWLMQFYRLAHPWSRPWRTGANVMWSLGAHTGVQTSADDMGAGELWFTRPVNL